MMAEILSMNQTLGIGYAMASVLLLLTALAMKKYVRLDGAASWLLYALLAPWPIVVAPFLAYILGVPLEYSVPLSAIAAVIGVVSFHILMPALLPDFQTSSISASSMLGFILGIALFGAGLATNYWVGAVPTNQESTFGTKKVEWD